MEQLDTSFPEERPFALDRSGPGFDLTFTIMDVPTNADPQSTEEDLERLQLLLQGPDNTHSPSRDQDPTANVLPASNSVAPAQGQQGNVSFNYQTPYLTPQQASAMRMQNSGFQQTQQPANGPPMQRMQQGFAQQSNVQPMQNASAPPMGQNLSPNPNNAMFTAQPMGHPVGNGAAFTAATPSLAQQGFVGGSTPMTMSMPSGGSSTNTGWSMGNTASNADSNPPVPPTVQVPLGPTESHRRIRNSAMKSPFELLQTFPARNTSELAMPHTPIDSFESLSDGVPSDFSQNMRQNLAHGSYFYHAGPPPTCPAPTNNPVATLLNNAVAVAVSTRKNAIHHIIDGIVDEFVRSGSLGGHLATHLVSSEPAVQTALRQQITTNLTNTYATDMTEDIYSAYAATSEFYAAHPEILESMLAKCQSLDEEEKDSTLGLINGNTVLALLDQRRNHLIEMYVTRIGPLSNLQRNAGQLGAPFPSQPIQQHPAMMASQSTQQMQQFSPTQPGQQLQQRQPMQQLQASPPMQQFQSGQHFQPVQPIQQSPAMQQFQQGLQFHPGQLIQQSPPIQRLHSGQPTQAGQPAQLMQQGQLQWRQLAPATAHAPSMVRVNGGPAAEFRERLRKQLESEGPADAKETPKPNGRKRGPGQSEESKGTKQARSRKRKAQEMASDEAPTAGTAKPAEEPNAT